MRDDMIRGGDEMRREEIMTVDVMLIMVYWRGQERSEGVRGRCERERVFHITIPTNTTLPTHTVVPCMLLHQNMLLHNICFQNPKVITIPLVCLSMVHIHLKATWKDIASKSKSKHREALRRNPSVLMADTIPSPL